MKVLDEKGRLFGIINIIDLFVLVVLVVIVAGGIWLVSRQSETDTGPVESYYVTIKCPELDGSIADYLHVGDRLYYANGFTDVVITDVSVEPAKIDVMLDDGTITVSTHPEKKDIYVTVKVNSKPDDPMLWIGQLHATVGKELVLKTQYVEIPGVITSVVKQEQ
ncbi:hypothetical protein Cst_c24460 [Thermoclostridium stercorarium subsp. stercorarium DSM 8532]|uniref:DUF4330 domain-containing protein n=3 Tax=Thermoclostridium stercorarium TaxID=1510 RepID=L7VSQ2_THES1|nr:DUF4330 domain-containing protein [Thermoclostridium stercorarium]AGC69406.1 hypothetical protein Cst_c24460 [Thermoclostridium stercorarium subsp. stercorarium DSM 8532]AGI40364.1 hypothetical protein Clst_2341 [Thermoclostridium stercorarium subsp. stercorarium DSM 8532]ANW99656.1 hypothetical protein CSTERTH_11725 [Thermoclostridium stercorarium subsp. thermolacticum DSM 2910]ANX02282.1 hypothetical protein CSTERLE_12220 [Thermoclostridium stercorarium subsp. leptospartum DSM 9219]UZQ853